MDHKYTSALLDIFEYLYLNDPIEKCDVVIGFGHFDLRIASQCYALYRKKFASKIIFTGGIGAGTADLPKPEADAFMDHLLALDPQINPNDIIKENQSTNTAENILFTQRLLAEINPDFNFQRGITSALLVANPYRQHRVYLTCRKHLHHLKFLNTPPESNLNTEIDLFQSKGFRLDDLMLGEVDRLIDYGKKEWIEPADIPKKVLEAYKVLKDMSKQ